MNDKHKYFENESLMTVPFRNCAGQDGNAHRSVRGITSTMHHARVRRKKSVAVVVVVVVVGGCSGFDVLRARLISGSSNIATKPGPKKGSRHTFLECGQYRAKKAFTKFIKHESKTLKVRERKKRRCSDDDDNSKSNMGRQVGGAGLGRSTMRQRCQIPDFCHPSSSFSAWVCFLDQLGMYRLAACSVNPFLAASTLLVCACYKHALVMLLKLMTGRSREANESRLSVTRGRC